MKWTAIGILMALTLAACERGTSSAPASGGPSTLERLQQAEAKRVKDSFNNAYVTCDPRNCPDSVAGIVLLYYENEKLTLGACSATLIEENKILTNAHCVPKDIRDGESCKGRLKFMFPMNPRYKGESFGCSKVIAMSEYKKKDQTSIQPDWAVIQLDGKSPRPLAKINLDGIEPFQKVRLAKVTFQSNLEGEVVGDISLTECEANNNHFKSHDNLGAFGPLFNIAHCRDKLFKGHSGSGVLNANNEVVGIFSFARFVEQSNDPWAVELRKKYPDITQTYGGGTNLKCVPYFHDEPLHPYCYYGGAKRYLHLSALYQKVFQSIMSTEKRSQALFYIDEYLINRGGSFVEWKTDQYYGLIPSAQANFIDEGIDQLFGVYQKALFNQFPFQPFCVLPGSPDEFVESVPVLMNPSLWAEKNKRGEWEFNLEAVVNPETFRATQKFRLKEGRFKFSRVDDFNYVMTAVEGDLVPPWLMDVLLIQPGSTQWNLPICESIAP